MPPREYGESEDSKVKTYQDWQAVGENEENKKDFIKALIEEHKSSAAYKVAKDAIEYDKRRNVTICNYRKWLVDAVGRYVPDEYTANHKLPSGFFPRFVTQFNQYLLGNGVNFEDDAGKEKLGVNFDGQLQKLGRSALVQGASYGFWNLDHIEIFELIEFAPLFDEETGAIRGGARFWQLSSDKPTHITLFEEDGYTQYVYDKTTFKMEREKAAYIKSTTVEPNGEIIAQEGSNYKGFPIIPLYANPHKQSELIGIREAIDCYDLIKSGFANDVDEATMVYWIITNAGGMDAKDVADFIRQLKHQHGASVDGDAGVNVTPHTTEAPYQARQAYLEQLKQDLYEDFQIVNVNQLSSGDKTATEIRAAYEPMNNKADQFEYCVLEFLHALFDIVGIEANPTFTRSMIVNELEETQMVLSAAQYLDDETLLKKLKWLTPEDVENILTRKAEESITRFEGGGE